ncbi:hypothetical protein P389DRAFT_112492 [Cystobasidium minutum MCA 4210]|uniref:uncharacterized protein n=1 Tax=Cystobasidium minutum MCA 4210 TaxID=1397322 RepID=UPI0034CE25CC|eukprot:jgi/Rhomi1/112492/CE112491_37
MPNKQRAYFILTAMAEVINGLSQVFSTRTIIVVSCALGGIALIVLVVILILYRRVKRRRRKNSPKARARIQPWLASETSMYISRPLHTPMKVETWASSPCNTVVPLKNTDDFTNANEEGGPHSRGLSERTTAQPMMIKTRPSSLIYVACDPHPVTSEAPLADLPVAREADPTRSDQSPANKIRLSLPAKALQRNTVAWRPRTLALVSKHSISGRTILIQDDTKTRPTTTLYNDDDYRTSVYPSTPSDPGHATLSRYATPAASRRATWAAPRWQEEPPLPDPGHARS